MNEDMSNLINKFSSMLKNNELLFLTYLFN